MGPDTLLAACNITSNDETPFPVPHEPVRLDISAIQTRHVCQCIEQAESSTRRQTLPGRLRPRLDVHSARTMTSRRYHCACTLRSPGRIVAAAPAPAIQDKLPRFTDGPPSLRQKQRRTSSWCPCESEDATRMIVCDRCCYHHRKYRLASMQIRA